MPSLDSNAQLTLKLDKGVTVLLDSIVSVKSQGIIGVKNIQVSLDGDRENLEDHGLIVDTESTVDLESLIIKFTFGSAKRRFANNRYVNE